MSLNLLLPIEDCLALLCVERWIPKGRFSKESAKRLYGFGIKMLASSMITTIYNDIRPLIIGKKFFINMYKVHFTIFY